jgi:hypothetical protein
MSDRSSEYPDSFWGTWEGKRQLKFVLALQASAEQRLAWLEEMIRIAHASGALPRRRDATGFELPPET